MAKEEQPKKKAVEVNSVITTCLDVVEVKTFNMDIPDIIVQCLNLHEDDRVSFVIEAPGKILFQKN